MLHHQNIMTACTTQKTGDAKNKKPSLKSEKSDDCAIIYREMEVVTKDFLYSVLFVVHK